MMKTIFVFTLFLPLNLWAVPSRDIQMEIGVSVFKCGTQIEILDHYEGSQLYDYTVEESFKNLSFQESILQAQRKWKIYSDDMARYFGMYVEIFQKTAQVMSGVVIDVTLDYAPLVQPADCHAQTVILSRGNQFGDEMFVDQDLWSQLTDFQKVYALHSLFIQHENRKSYMESIIIWPSKTNEFSFVNTRAFNSFFWSTGFGKQSFKDFLGLISRLSFVSFMWRGMEINLQLDYTFHPNGQPATFKNSDTYDPSRDSFLTDVLGQQLEIAQTHYPAEISLYPDGQLKCFNIKNLSKLPDSVKYYRSTQMNHEMLFTEGPLNSQICLYPGGRVEKGYGKPVKPFTYRTQTVEAEMVQTHMEFWPSGELKFAGETFGKIFVQGQWVKFQYGLILRENGQPECANLLPGQVLRDNNGHKIKVVENNLSYCFDVNGLVTNRH